MNSTDANLPTVSTVIRKKKNFVSILKATDKKSRIRIRYPVFGSKHLDPDPSQNLTDLEHWRNNENCTYGHIVGGIDADSGHIGTRAGSDVRDPIRKNASKNRRADVIIPALK